MYSTRPELLGTGIELMPMLYLSSGANVYDPLKPRLDCIANGGGEFVVKPLSVRQMADYVRQQGYSRIIFDWESTRGADVHTDDSRQVAEDIVGKFRESGVALDVWGCDPSEYTDWIDRTNGARRLYAAWYMTFTRDPGVWERHVLETLADCRKRYRGREIWLVVSPFSEGDDPKGPPKGEIAEPAIDAMQRVGSRYFDGLVWWAGRMTEDGTGYLPWQPEARWFKRVVAAVKA